MLPEFFKELDYGQIVKIRANGKVVDKEKWTMLGIPSLKSIETYNVENFNSNAPKPPVTIGPKRQGIQ